jgi:hypothetical protein
VDTVGACLQLQHGVARMLHSQSVVHLWNHWNLVGAQSGAKAQIASLLPQHGGQEGVPTLCAVATGPTLSHDLPYPGCCSCRCAVWHVLYRRWPVHRRAAGVLCCMASIHVRVTIQVDPM